MKRLVALILLLAGSAAEARTADPAAQFREALAKYEEQQFAEGLALFQSVLTNLNETVAIDPAKVHYNIGCGLYRQGQPEQAAASFKAALQTPDLDVQQRAYYNLGTAQSQQAGNKLNEGDPAAALQLFHEATQSYIQAMRLDPDDRDAKINYELALQARQHILALVAEALARLQQGEQLVAGSKFVEAARWFQQNLPELEQTLKAKPDAQKKAGTLATRTVEVAEIMLGSPEFIQPTLPPIEPEAPAP